MSELAVATPAKRSALMEWLRYDETRVEPVEAAYRTFVERGRPGVFLVIALFGGFFAAFIAGIVGYVNGLPRTQLGMWGAVVFMVAFYALLIVPVLRCPKEALKEIGRGCVDLRRAIVFALLGSTAIAVLEFLAIVALSVARVMPPKTPIDLLSYGVGMGFVIVVVAAPVAEEFMMQGWLQTRLLRFGTPASAVLTTIVFVLVHFPGTLYELVRAGVLAFVAYLRATTRSLFACIVAHACNNAIFMALAITYFATHHKAHH